MKGNCYLGRGDVGFCCSCSLAAEQVNPLFFAEVFFPRLGLATHSFNFPYISYGGNLFLVVI